MESFFEWMGDNILWVYVIIILVVVTLGLLQPKFEADAYKRLTGKQVTYWDAVWLDLRIQEQVKG